MAWHWDSPETTCKEDLEVILSNGQFQYAVGDRKYYRYDSQIIPLITTRTVTGGCCDKGIDKHGALALISPSSGYSVRDVI